MGASEDILSLRWANTDREKSRYCTQMDAYIRRNRTYLTYFPLVATTREALIGGDTWTSGELALLYTSPHFEI